MSVNEKDPACVSQRHIFLPPLSLSFFFLVDVVWLSKSKKVYNPHPSHVLACPLRPSSFVTRKKMKRNLGARKDHYKDAVNKGAKIRMEYSNLFSLVYVPVKIIIIKTWGWCTFYTVIDRFTKNNHLDKLVSRGKTSVSSGGCCWMLMMMTMMMILSSLLFLQMDKKI